MNLLGAHIIGQSGPHLDTLRRLDPAMCLFLDPDRGDLAWFKQALPGCVVVGRIYRPDSEVSDRIHANPQQAAQWAHSLVMEHEARDLVDYWQIANEVCQVEWPEFNQLVVFERERMRMADACGYKCGIFAFSVGNPVLEYWPATYSALEYAEEHGHALLIHQYGCCPDIFGPEHKGGAEWLLQRFETQVSHRLPHKPRVYCTEYGYDGMICGGEPAGWQTAQTARTYATHLMHAVARLENPVDGYAIFQLGDGGHWGTYNIAGDVLDRLARGSEQMTLQDTLRKRGQEAQVIQFNPAAALQKRIFLDGFVPNSPEFDVDYNGSVYRGQRAEHLGTGVVRVYYCEVGNWENVRWC
jgi:hypothetical protein